MARKNTTPEGTFLLGPTTVGITNPPPLLANLCARPSNASPTAQISFLQEQSQSWPMGVHGEGGQYSKGMTHHALQVTYADSSIQVRHLAQLDEQDHYLILRDLLCALCVLSQDPLLHASTAMVGDAGVAFCGYSGTGKSTAARTLSKHVPIVNDEIAWVHWRNGRPCLVNQRAWRKPEESPDIPLRMIFLLAQSETCRTEAASFAEAFPLLLCAPYGLQDPNVIQRSANTIHLANSVPIRHLHCNLDPDDLYSTVQTALSESEANA